MLTVTVGKNIKIPLNQLTPAAVNIIKGRFTFDNHLYWMAVKLKKSSRGIPKRIQGWRASIHNLYLPRGAAFYLFKTLTEIGLPYVVVDETRKLPEVDFNFQGKLKELQLPAVKAILGRRFSTICSPTGSGKTIMGLYTIAERKQPALVIVHTNTLMEQWVDRAEQFLGLNRDEIGIVSDGKVRIGARLTIAMNQTLYKLGHVVAPHIGYMLVDEVHHTPADTFYRAVSVFDSIFMCGLSATHNRRDKKTPLIYWYVGPLVHEVPVQQLIASGDVMFVEPIIRQTNFQSDSENWCELLDQLASNEERNKMIVADVLKEIKHGPCVVLTDRVYHCEILADLINATHGGVIAKPLYGAVKARDRDMILSELKDETIKVVVATGSLLGEGFDEKKLTALFLAAPIGFDGRLTQYIGRVARTDKGKTHAVVYDYHDDNNEMLLKAAIKRIKAYKKMKKNAQY